MLVPGVWSPSGVTVRPSHQDCITARAWVGGGGVPSRRRPATHTESRHVPNVQPPVVEGASGHEPASGARLTSTCTSAQCTGCAAAAAATATATAAAAPVPVCAISNVLMPTVLSHHLQAIPGDISAHQRAAAIHAGRQQQVRIRGVPLEAPRAAAGVNLCARQRRG